MLCLVAQSCLTLRNPMDCSLPGSSVHGDSPGKNARVCCHALLQGIFSTPGSNPGLLHCSWILYRLSHQEAHIRSTSLANFKYTKESDQIRSDQLLSHVRLFATPQPVACQAPLSMEILQARILEWVAMPSSRESSQPRDWTQFSCIAGRFFTI